MTNLLRYFVSSLFSFKIICNLSFDNFHHVVTYLFVFAVPFFVAPSIPFRIQKLTIRYWPLLGVYPLASWWIDISSAPPNSVCLR